MYLGAPAALRENGAAAGRSNAIFYGPPLRKPVFPGPMPVWNPPITWRGPIVWREPLPARTICEHAAPPEGCDWLAIPTASNPCNVKLNCRPSPSVVPSSASSPVPTGFPTSQLFVNSDGSFWEYSPTQFKWVNVGTPYNTGASATPGAPRPSPSGGSTAAPAGTTAPGPVNVTIASAPSLHQGIFDWLQKSTTLFGMNVPNFVLGGGAALLAYKMTQGGKK